LRPGETELMSRKNGCCARCGLTDWAASTLEAAVTAEMIVSAPRAASAAEVAQRTPIAAASLSFFAVRGREKNVPGGDLFDAGLAQTRCDGLSRLTEADERYRGLAGRHGLFLIRHYGFFRRVRWEMTLFALCRNAAMPAARLHRRRRPIGCVTKK
jgi:hypothetical protein